MSVPKRKARVLTVPNHPLPHTLAIADQIRRDFGHGGARFPGSKELYEAADRIEAWAGEWEWPEEES